MTFRPRRAVFDGDIGKVQVCSDTKHKMHL